MTNAMSVRLAPVGESALPETRITNAAQPIPVVTWESEDGWQTVEIQLGNHPDPAGYLRDLGRLLTAFAYDVDAARGQRPPKGYDAPATPYTLNDGAFDERLAAEVGS